MRALVVVFLVAGAVLAALLLVAAVLCGWIVGRTWRSLEE